MRRVDAAELGHQLAVLRDHLILLCLRQVYRLLQPATRQHSQVSEQIREHTPFLCFAEAVATRVLRMLTMMADGGSNMRPYIDRRLATQVRSGTLMEVASTKH